METPGKPALVLSFTTPDTILVWAAQKVYRLNKNEVTKIFKYIR
jgi:hypothetical protein